MLLARVWWTYIVRGSLAIVFAILALLLPAAAFVALVFLFGFYAGLSGLLSFMAAFSREPEADAPRWVLVLQGLAGLGAAVIAFLLPGMTAIMLMFIVAAWAVVTGILELILAVRLRREIEGEWRLALAGVASIAVGLLVFLFPAAGMFALWVLIAAYAFGVGASLIALGFMLRRRARVHAWTSS